MSVYQIHVFMRMDVKICLIITIVLVNWVGQENSVAQVSLISWFQINNHWLLRKVWPCSHALYKSCSYVLFILILHI